MFFSANWTWSAQPHKRALAIAIDETGTQAVRIAASHNPGIMTIYPFTEICYYFQLNIRRLGKFVGVGKKTFFIDKIINFPRSCR